MNLWRALALVAVLFLASFAAAGLVLCLGLSVFGAAMGAARDMDEGERDEDE